MRRRYLILSVKYIVYGILLVLLFVLQSTPHFLSIHGVKPLLVIPFAVSIAMFERETVGGFFGAIAGVLCDYGSPFLFGFNSIFLTVEMVLVGFSISYFLRLTKLNCCLLTFAACFLRSFFEFLFEYAIWGYPGISAVFLSKVVYMTLFTVVFAVPLFLLVEKIKKVFDVKLNDD